MRNLWTTTDLMYYYNKSAAQIKRWREDGLKCIQLGIGYVYYYKDIVEYLGE
jgi:hypothetical protein